MKTISLLFASCVLALGADFAWQTTNPYRPPNFEATFPHDSEAAKELPMVVAGRAVVSDSIELFRRGLRAQPVDQQTISLRWFGNQYIWNQSPQNTRAIDLMYHAAGAASEVVRYHAIYFGLSTVRPMTPPILRVLVEIALDSDDPNLLSRIAWGTSGQRDEVLRELQSNAKARDPVLREKAESVRQMLAGELQAFAWAEARARDAALKNYSARLEEIRASLLNGTSAQRKETLDLIQRERIALIMEESFIDAFAAAASDPDPKVREPLGLIVGERWIWKDAAQPESAIELMLRLSRDPLRQVRYNAHYYGLSTLRDRSPAVVERMLEMLLQDGVDDRNFRDRVKWGLEKDRETLRNVLRQWMNQAGAIRPLFAYGFARDFFQEAIEPTPSVAELLKNPGREAALILGFLPTEHWKGKTMDDFLSAVLESLPPDHARRLLWTNNQGPPFVILETTQAAEIQKSLSSSGQVKINVEVPLTIANLVQLGEKGGFKTLGLKPRQNSEAHEDR